MIKDLKRLPGTFPGVRYCRAMQASVDAILVPRGIERRVLSRGTEFENRDAWTLRAFAKFLCEALLGHPERVPTRDELKGLVRKANGIRCRDPHIKVAKMPEWVNERVALAIIGGGYHEAWHTLYSRRDPVRLSEVQPVVEAARPVVDGGGRFDAKLCGLLFQLYAFIEDVRIERRGNEQFPGAIQPLRDLQDFILDLEARSHREGAKLQNVTVSDSARSILIRCLRDLGLGYNTQRSREALEHYRTTSPETVAMLAPGGVLAPLLQELKGLGKRDEIASLVLAMKFVSVLWEATQSDPAAAPADPACPNCGAPPSQLVIRSIRTPEGVRIRGRAELECRTCGYTTEIEPPDHSLNFDQRSEPADDAEMPEIEDREEAPGAGGGDGGDGAEDGDGGAGDESERGEQREDDETPAAGDEEGTSDGTGTAGAEKGDEEDEPTTGSDGEDLAEGEEGTDGMPTGARDVGGRESVDADEDWECTVEELLENSAGGLNLDLGQDPESSLNASEDILDGDESEGALSSGEALEEAIARQEKKDHHDLKAGEMVWNPHDPMLDEARLVRSKNQETDLRTANEMLNAVNSEVAYMRARLRIIFRAQEMVSVVHGVPRGRRLSDRMLVESRAELMGGKAPTRAYQTATDVIDTSLATVLVLDQSSSMAALRRVVAQCMLMVADALEGVGAATMACGFRNGAHGDYSREFAGSGWEATYHRIRGVRYDVFKTWEERLATVKWRFGHTQASGSTPMADGVQYGLSALNERLEAHRVLGIITDGCPDDPHELVIRRQVRLAKAAGIHVLGIGITDDARYVEDLFPDHVWAKTVHELPQPLMVKLNDLCDFAGRFRGRRAQLDGSVVQRVT